MIALTSDREVFIHSLEYLNNNKYSNLEIYLEVSQDVEDILNNLNFDSIFNKKLHNQTIIGILTALLYQKNEDFIVMEYSLCGDNISLYLRYRNKEDEVRLERDLLMQELHCFICKGE